MKFTFFGTRGSTPISNQQSSKYGGNTTCLRVDSPCFPPDHWLVADTGTGIVPLSQQFAQSGGKAMTILFTHYHHDHTQGFPLSLMPYLKHVPIHLYGPYEHGIGPREVFQTLMKSPFFPVNIKEVASHMSFHNIEYPNVTVLIFHPEGGAKRMELDAYEQLMAKGRQIPFKIGAFHVQECLVVRMHRSNHPEQTISYRFEEGPTGKVGVFVTDHENQDRPPKSFRDHLSAADLLVMDGQYERKKYDAVTAGWGHGTPDYIAGVAREVGAKCLGITHHDPWSDDDTIDRIVDTAKDYLADVGISVFGCRDYETVEV